MGETPNTLRATRHSRDLRVHLDAATAELEAARSKADRDSAELQRRLAAAIAAVKAAQEALEDRDTAEGSGGP